MATFAATTIIVNRIHVFISLLLLVDYFLAFAAMPFLTMPEPVSLRQFPNSFNQIKDMFGKRKDILEN
jgi:hypothetical protein